MPRIRMIVEYDGAGFCGWQHQPGQRTIQSELNRVFEIVFQKPVEWLQASGRTDSGVHAKAQVVCFTVPELPDLLRVKRAVSSLLRGELSVLSIEVVRDNFDACAEVTSKQYSYTIINRDVPAVLDRRCVWLVPQTLDRERMCLEAQSIVGVHDFTSFRSMGAKPTSPVREIFESVLEIQGDYLVYRVVGRGFLKQMVRNIVGTLVGIGGGSLKHTNMLEILAAHDRRAAGQCAPAHGLCLDWVRYE